MISLGDIERRVRETGDLSVFEQTHLHRAAIEDAMGRTRGRDRLRDRALARLAEEGLGPVQIDAQSDGFVAFTTAAGWRGHRWAVREGERVLSEAEVIDGAARAAALGRELDAAARSLGAHCPLHEPFGELQAGRGQLATADEPELPPGFAPDAMAGARWLHRFWNARSLDLAPPSWTGPASATQGAGAFALQLLAALPDAVCLIERSVQVGDRVALLWRLHGHHLGEGLGVPSKRRVRVIGSSLLTLEGSHVTAEDMLIDTLAIHATRYRPLVDYHA